MPRKNLTSIVVILDKSSSMSVVQDKTIEGFNSFVDAQRKEPGEARLTLIQFDTNYDIQMVNRPLGDVPHLNRTTYAPSGMTALLDAVGRGIDELGQSLSHMLESDRPEHVIFVIVTDGEENSSREYNKEPGKVAAMVKLQEDVYKWKFTYLGAGPNALQQAAHLLNISGDKAAAYRVGNEKAVFDVASASVSRGRAGASLDYTLGERKGLMADNPEDHPHRK